MKNIQSWTHAINLNSYSDNWLVSSKGTNKINFHVEYTFKTFSIYLIFQNTAKVAWHEQSYLCKTTAICWTSDPFFIENVALNLNWEQLFSLHHMVSENVRKYEIVDNQIIIHYFVAHKTRRLHFTDDLSRCFDISKVHETHLASNVNKSRNGNHDIK